MLSVAVRALSRAAMGARVAPRALSSAAVGAVEQAQAAVDEAASKPTADPRRMLRWKLITSLRLGYTCMPRKIC